MLGTTRVGKTRLAELFITQDIRRKVRGELRTFSHRGVHFASQPVDLTPASHGCLQRVFQFQPGELQLFL